MSKLPLSRRDFGKLGVGLAASLALSTWPALAARQLSQDPRKLKLQPFTTAPFPYHGKLPDSDVDFLDASSGNRRGHTAPRGGIYWEDQTYYDNHVLLAIPKGYNLKAPSAIVVYFHGNGAILDRDVVQRQAIVDQLEASGLNAPLVAPQFAVDAQDSSAGRFWQPGAFPAFMAEASTRLASLYGAAKAKKVFDTVPIVLIAYSGGYNPAAYVLEDGYSRIKGVMLLDAVFADEDKFAAWIAKHHKGAFFFSAYTKSSEPGNVALQNILQSKRIAFGTGIPTKFTLGSTNFFRTDDDVEHNDFLTAAWEDWPLKGLLQRIS